MDNWIKIIYQRDHTTYSGELRRPKDEADTKEEVLCFTGWEFNKIIRALHLWTLERPAHEMQWIRRDVPPHLPYVLESELVRLIRVDPVAAIRAMSPAPVTVSLRNKPVGQTIKVGWDVLADAFGEWVFLATEEGMSSSSVECPFCGGWAELHEAHISCACSPNTPLSYFNHTGVSTRWVRVLTKNLLSRPVERFYIPRAWNQPGPWISKSDLTAKFETYTKELEKCLDSNQV